jgi:transcription initiation factor TFIID subunit TAF12
LVVKEEKMIDPKEKENLRLLIERELKEKGKIIVNTEKTNPEVTRTLLDICILNKLRDANEK